jgi:hypothetical protein
MEETGISILVVAFWGLILVMRRGSYTSTETRYLAASFAMHVAFSFVIIWLSEGGGDLLGYFGVGHVLARGMRKDPGLVIDVIRMFFHSTDVPFGDDFVGVGTSTGSLKAIAAFAMLFTLDSEYGAFLLITIPSFFGKVALYRMLRDQLPAELHPRLLVATLLVPSFVFWSCGFVKEGVVVSCLGWMMVGLGRLGERKMVKGVLLILIPGTIVAMVKAYVLFPFIIASAFYLYWSRARQRNATIELKPRFVVLALITAVAGIAALSQLFPEYAVDTLADKTARYQELGEEVGGGSYYSLGEGSDRSLSAQLAYTPLALIACFFRPFIFEVHNGPMLASALEMTALFVLFFRTVRKRSWSAVWSYIWSSPILMFAMMFTLLFGTGVGLATSNLGTLSRYRVPLLPFYVLLVLVLEKAKVVVRAEDAAPAEPEPARRRRLPPSRAIPSGRLPVAGRPFPRGGALK